MARLESEKYQSNQNQHGIDAHPKHSQEQEHIAKERGGIVFGVHHVIGHSAMRNNNCRQGNYAMPLETCHIAPQSTSIRISVNDQLASYEPASIIRIVR